MRHPSCYGAEGGEKASASTDEKVDVVAPLLDRSDAAWQGVDRLVGDGVLQPGHDVLADGAVTTVPEGLDRVVDGRQIDLPLQPVKRPQSFHQTVLPRLPVTRQERSQQRFGRGPARGNRSNVIPIHFAYGGQRRSRR